MKKNVLIINAHQYYPFAEGKLNAAMVEKAEAFFEAQGHEVKVVTMKDQWDATNEVEKHLWADLIVLQSPVNWMGVPWSFKKYMDEVYTAGMMGALSNGDGRSSEAPKANYGMGGLLKNTKYMLSLTFNAPKEAFDNPEEPFFNGKSVDDLFWAMHLNFKFFAMEALPTFACYDVMKNPEIEKDFTRFDAHLKENCANF